jgi:hypothetical protein
MKSDVHHMSQTASYAHQQLSGTMNRKNKDCRWTGAGYSFGYLDKCLICAGSNKPFSYKSIVANILNWSIWEELDPWSRLFPMARISSLPELHSMVGMDKPLDIIFIQPRFYQLRTDIKIFRDGAIEQDIY